MADRVKVGGLWIKKSSKGEFWSGNIDVKKLIAEATAAGQNMEKVNIVIFPNERQEAGKNHPDLNINFSDWKPNQK